MDNAISSQVGVLEGSNLKKWFKLIRLIFHMLMENIRNECRFDLLISTIWQHFVIRLCRQNEQTIEMWTLTFGWKAQNIWHILKYKVLRRIRCVTYDNISILVDSQIEAVDSKKKIIW